MATAPRYFYADAINGKRIALLAGPFATEAQAREYVEPARKLMAERDPWSHFYLFGVTSFARSLGAGKLNVQLWVDSRNLISY